MLFGPQHEKLPAGVPIVFPDGTDQIFETDVVFSQGVRVHTNLKLKHVSPHGENIRDPRDSPKLEFDHPVVDFPQIGAGIFPVGVYALIQGQIVYENLPEPRGYGAQRGRFIHFGQFRHCRGKPFTHKLSGKIDIHIVLEIDVHHSQAEGGGALDLRHTGQAVHGRLNGIGNQTLHLFGGHAMGLGKDGHHNGRYVGKGLHRHLVVFINAETQDSDDG